MNQLLHEISQLVSQVCKACSLRDYVLIGNEKSLRVSSFYTILIKMEIQFLIKNFLDIWSDKVNFFI